MFYKNLLFGLSNYPLYIKYTNTIHNIGEIIIRKLMFSYSIYNCVPSSIYTSKVSTNTVCMISNGFINNSGMYLKHILGKFFMLMQLKNIFIVFDDLSLQIGKIKITRGSSFKSGHNGVKNIIFHLHNILDKIIFLRIGASSKRLMVL